MNIILNPLIFTKKKFVKTSTLNNEIISFEYILAMVCKLYYKESFSIEDYLKMFNINDKIEKESITKTSNAGRKSSKRRGKVEKVSEKKKKGKNNDEDFDIVPPIDTSLDILESLISPIREDKEYGKF